MWPTKKIKIKKKKTKSALHRRVWWVGWERGVYRKKKNILQGYKSNQKFYRGEKHY